MDLYFCERVASIFKLGMLGFFPDWAVTFDKPRVCR